jgi:hypothetical protein
MGYKNYSVNKNCSRLASVNKNHIFLILYLELLYISLSNPEKGTKEERTKKTIVVINDDNVLEIQFRLDFSHWTPPDLEITDPDEIEIPPDMVNMSRYLLWCVHSLYIRPSEVYSFYHSLTMHLLSNFSQVWRPQLTQKRSWQRKRGSNES